MKIMENSMKLKDKLVEKNVIEEMYPLVSKMFLTRLPVYQQVGRVESMKQTNRTVRLEGIGKNGGYIVELKRHVRVGWKGKTPILLTSKKAKWEVVSFKLVK